MHVRAGPARSSLARPRSLMAAPSAASAATGPLLSLTPERVSNGHLALAGQPWRVRVVMQPWVEGQTATVRFYRHGHKLRVVNVNLTTSPTGKSGMARSSPSAPRSPGRRPGPGHAPRDAARRPSSWPSRCASTSRRCSAAPGRARPGRAPAPAAPGGQGLRRRPARPLRPAHRARGARLPQGRRAWRARRVADTGSSRRCWPARAPSRCAIPSTASTSRPTSRARSSRSSRARRWSASTRRARASRRRRRSRAASGSTRRPPGFNAKGMYYSNYFIRGFAIHGYADGAGLRRQPRLPAHPDPRRDLDLPLDQDRRHRRRLPVGLLGLGHEQVEQRRHPAAGVRGALAVGAVALGAGSARCPRARRPSRAPRRAAARAPARRGRPRARGAARRPAAAARAARRARR